MTDINARKEMSDVADAIISPCGLYRYWLSRKWSDAKNATFIMLNPSTADAKEDDATIRRCVNYAKEWDCGGLEVVNLFAFRATKPKDMFAADDPVGPENMFFIYRAIPLAKYVVCAWGANGGFKQQDEAVISFLNEPGNRRVCKPSKVVPELLCLGQTKKGQPKHPLYLRKDEKLRIFRP